MKSFRPRTESKSFATGFKNKEDQVKFKIDPKRLIVKQSPLINHLPIDWYRTRKD